MSNPVNTTKDSLLLRYARFLREMGFVCFEPRVRTSGSDETKEHALHALTAEIKTCRKCVLCEKRINVVCGEGNPSAEIVFVGEAPGQKEDEEGRPFVGPAGNLLSHYIQTIGLTREDVYICNVIKCRPPGNRDPQGDEMKQCSKYLFQQIEIINPKVICTLGRFAAQTLLDVTTSISQLRGKVCLYKNFKVVPTFHPASLLYNAAYKEQFEKDFALLRQVYEEEKKAGS